MPLKQPVPSFLERVILFDPGYTRLKTATRGSVAVLCSYLLSLYLVHQTQASPSLPFLGVIIAMMGSVALVDLRRKEEKFAILFMPLPAGLAMIAAVSLGSWPPLRLVMFLVFSFLAVLMRRFGAAWAGIGLVMFMAYFTSLFFPFHAQDIPWALVTILIGTATTYAVRFWLIPDFPRRILRQLIDAFILQEKRMLTVVVACLRTALEQKFKPTGHELPPLWLPVRASFIRLNELALAIEQYVDRSDTPSIRSASSAFELKLFEREFLLRRLWDASASLFRKFPENEAIREAIIRDVESVLTPGTQPASLEEFQNSEGETGPLIRDFLQARQNLMSALMVPLVSEAAQEPMDPTAEPKRPPSSAKSKGRLHFTTRQAIQATLATALASFIGNSLNAQRWYWASISAFIVFIGASRGDTTIRATLRILGTVLGLGLGFLLAYAVSKNSTLEWAFIIVSIFLALYMARLNFGFWTAMLFSAMFALLYDRLGLMTSDILFLRLEETLIGALMGILVASIVLPTSTHAVVREAVAQYLRTVALIMEELRKNLPSQFSRRTLIRQLRDMDRDLMNLRVMAAPIVGRGSLMKRGGIPGILHDSTAMGHFLRHLALHVEPQTGKEGFHEACQELIDGLHEQAEAIEKGQHRPLTWNGAAQHLSQLDPSARYYMKCLRLSLMSMANRRV